MTQAPNDLRTARSAQALQYMRKLCSHPALVLDPGNAAHAAALAAGAPGEALPLRGLHHAPKLAALAELLHQCGIGRGAGVGPPSLDMTGLFGHCTSSRSLACVMSSMDGGGNSWCPRASTIKAVRTLPGRGWQQPQIPGGLWVCTAAGGPGADAEAGGGAPAHRALVFAQHRSLLDLVETEAGPACLLDRLGG